MPRGKGTYGKQVGRPPKNGKKKYYGGGSVDPFSSKNPEGVVAKKGMEDIEQQNMAQEGIPTANAQERSQTYQLGGSVRPPTAPSISPEPQYEEGGKVRDTSEKGLEKHWKKSVREEAEGVLKGRINYKPKRGTKHDKPDKPYNITDVVKTVGHKESIKKGYKEYWDKENKAIKKKKGKK